MKESMKKKGGLNPYPPTMARPAEAPKGQGGKLPEFHTHCATCGKMLLGAVFCAEHFEEISKKENL